MKRIHFFVLIGIATAVAAIIFASSYFYVQALDNNQNKIEDSKVIKARLGDKVYIRYSTQVIKLIQDMPAKNNLTLISSAQLHNTDLGALKGQFSFTDEIISYTQNGEVRTEEKDVFRSVEYRFRPDIGTNTTYIYENAGYVAYDQSTELIATFEQLRTAEIGDTYTVQLFLHAGAVTYKLNDRIVEIVP